MNGETLPTCLQIRVDTVGQFEICRMTVATRTSRSFVAYGDEEWQPVSLAQAKATLINLGYTDFVAGAFLSLMANKGDVMILFTQPTGQR